MNKKGYVISDLHLFTRRSKPNEIIEELENRLVGADFCVFNGDIFDFKWSGKGIAHCIEWLESRITRFPDCHFHFIVGNHDALPGFIKALSELGYSNFSVHETHLQLGDQLYLHGDLPLRGKNPFHRMYPQLGNPPSFIEYFYCAILFLRFHRILNILFTARYCTRKIWRSLEKHDPALLQKVRNVYFGHTHVPFEAQEYRGVLFHNTGSGIQHSQCNLIQVGMQ
jgi:UDP-2,3-diacylglucosamine hydrolase